MRAKSKKVLEVISGWEVVELVALCVFYGLWQFVKITFKQLWTGRNWRSKNLPPVELSVDNSIGTHCYIKIMGVKYHYVETGPKHGDLVLILDDAPDPGLLLSPTWPQVVRRLKETGYRIITLDLRGTGGSESGNRVDLSPPRAVEELVVLLETLGVSEHKPASVVGCGVGGMLGWYLVHCHGSMVSKFVAVEAPHPNLYWQYPPAQFCQKSLHFIQWPVLPERWLASSRASKDGATNRWANSRACDWTGALNYVRGAAWWRIRSECTVDTPTLLVGKGGVAAQLVASAERCRAPTLRLVTTEKQIENSLIDYLIEKDKLSDTSEGEWRGGLVGRMFGAVAGRGRELSARLLLPPTPA